MPTKKKNTKKYDLSRSAIVERLAELIENLESIDTHEDSPNGVATTIEDVISDLQNLQEDVETEAF